MSPRQSETGRVPDADTVKRAVGGLSFPVQAFGIYLILMTLQAFFAREFLKGNVLLQACLLLIAPRIVGRALMIAVPLALELMVAILVAMTLVAGELLHLYDTVWWWDIPPHFLAGFLFAAIARLSLVRAYHVEPQSALERALMIAAIVAISLGASALWELYEFGADTLLGTHMQPNGADTMHDLLAGLVGALCAPLVRGYLRKP